MALTVLAAALGGLALAAEAGASGTISVTPATGLTDGQSVSVSGSGFTATSTGAVIECNNDPGQPTLAVLGNSVPVSCTNPLSHIKTTSSSGALASFTFTVVTGTTGPPGSGTDSSGGDAATDAANYPCPPTAAQVAAGDSCVIAFGDQAGDQATFDISFSGGGGGTTTTTTAATTTTTSASTTTTTHAGTTTTTTGSATTTTQPTTTTTTHPGSINSQSPPPPSNPPNNASSGASNSSTPGLTVMAGQSTYVAGSGFSPGEQVNVVMYSSPVQLAVFTANAQGLASGYVTIPADEVGGTHILYMTGVTSGHQVQILCYVESESSVATSAATTAATTGATAGKSSGASSLAYTGAGHGLWLTLVGALVLIDLGYLLVSTFLRPRDLLACRGRRRSGSA